MKALIAIDSFKGCLTSAQAGNAALRAFPDGCAEIIPVSDGGEGFSTTLTGCLGGTFRTVSCHDPLGRVISAKYGVAGRTAVIETAAASGLGLLRRNELNPVLTSSYGTGELMLDALEHGAEEIWLGLGGSATCDGGIGLLQALGYRFRTDEAKSGSSLVNIQEIDSSCRCKALDSCKITGFYDVSVPFCGPGGAARMFAPQKGASPAMVEMLDEWMSRLCETYVEFSEMDVMNIPGSGAAGGIGGALGGVLGATMAQGIHKVLDIAGFGQKLKSCDLVITGEGRADIQTLRGKVPVGVLEYSRRHRAPGKSPKVILIAGRLSDKEQLLEAGFDAVLQVTPEDTPLSVALAPATAEANITRTIKEYQANL